MREIRKILVPTDFSDTAEEALHYAVDLARRFKSAVTLLHVYQLPAYPVSDLVLAWPNAYRDILDRAGAELDARKAAFERADAEQGLPPVPLDTQLAEGTPFSEIVQFASENEYDLIVVGTHGRTGFNRLLLGSVAERIVRAAHCPVLTVRPSAATRAAAVPAP